eukprot:4861608-Ditylum_brightwellii.AAC.1
MERENVKISLNKSQETSQFEKTSSRKAKEKEARSAHPLYHRTAKAPASLVCKGRQTAGQKVPPNRQRGQGSQR